jgi:hypothetical protein
MNTDDFILFSGAARGAEAEFAPPPGGTASKAAEAAIPPVFR